MGLVRCKTNTTSSWTQTTPGRAIFKTNMVNGSTVFPKFVGSAGEQFPLMRVAPPVGGWGPPPPPGLETRRSPIIVTQLVWTDGCQVDSHDGVTGQDHITIYMQRRILDKKYQILRPYYIQKLIDLTPPTNEGVKSTILLFILYVLQSTNVTT